MTLIDSPYLVADKVVNFEKAKLYVRFINHFKIYNNKLKNFESEIHHIVPISMGRSR